MPISTSGQRTNGRWAMLSNAYILSTHQRLMGAANVHRTMVHEYILAKPNNFILDLGCGLCGILKYLTNVSYVGVDSQRKYINQASRQFNEFGTFLCQDATILDDRFTSKFNIVTIRGLLHHLSDTDARSVVNVAYQALKAGGRMVSIDPVWMDNQKFINRVLISIDRGKNIRTVDNHKALLTSRFDNVKIHLRNNLLRFNYNHIISQCEKLQ